MRDVSLSTWIKQQEGRNDPIGDLAFDANRDSGWPEGSLVDLCDYLPTPAHRVLQMASDEYEAKRQAGTLPKQPRRVCGGDAP